MSADACSRRSSCTPSGNSHQRHLPLLTIILACESPCATADSATPNASRHSGIRQRVEIAVTGRETKSYRSRGSAARETLPGHRRVARVDELYPTVMTNPDHTTIVTQWVRAGDLPEMRKGTSTPLDDPIWVSVGDEHPDSNGVRTTTLPPPGELHQL